MVSFFARGGETVSDVAGEVVEVGPGVQEFKVGDKVVSMLNTFVSFSLSFDHRCWPSTFQVLFISVGRV